VTPLYAGGGPAVFWAPIIACIASLLITLGLAELSSAFPSSGGQYHATSLVSPPKYRAALSFTVGWLSALAWLFTTASANLFCASLCINLATLKNPDYVPQAWQTWLMYTMFIVICSAIVIYLPRWIPRLETFFFWTSLVGFVVNTIVLLAVSPTKQSSQTVFAEWTNLTGWDNGVAMLLAIGQSMYGFLCTDSAMHIAEELPSPSVHVPRAMWMTVAIGIATTIPFTLSVLFSMQDLEAVSLSGLPIMEVYLQALRGNSDAALFFTFWILFIYCELLHLPRPHPITNTNPDIVPHQSEPPSALSSPQAACSGPSPGTTACPSPPSSPKSNPHAKCPAGPQFSHRLFASSTA
jgi:choline transport protein